MRVKVGATLLTLPAVAASLRAADENRDAAWRHEAAVEADALIAKAPSNARGYSLRGAICEALGEPPLSCLRLYAKCLAIDPASAQCKDSYASAAQKYTSPRCTGASIRPDLGLRLGTTAARPGAKLETVEETALYLDASPSFTSRDLESIEARQVTMEEPTLDPDTGAIQTGPAHEETVALVTVRKERRAAFAAWLATAPDRGGYLVVSRGAVPLFHGQLHRSAPITSSWTIPAKLDALCTKIERPTLPADLPPVGR